MTKTIQSKPKKAIDTMISTNKKVDIVKAEYNSKTSKTTRKIVIRVRIIIFFITLFDINATRPIIKKSRPIIPGTSTII